jgi:hypothetical protein
MPDKFDDRVFLTEHEHAAYLRRAPVRFIRGRKHEIKCAHCGKPAQPDNKLQHAHRIPFLKGVLEFGLTPDFLDAHVRIVSAHARKCNDEVEWSSLAICQHLVHCGVERLPSFVALALQQEFSQVVTSLK